MARLNLFVYGSLKRGYEYHERFCGGAASVTEATVRGRLYEMPTGYPALAVPDEAVHLVGTADPAADAEAAAGSLPATAGPIEGWDTVHGELYTFDDPDERLPGIDRLESFYSDGESRYLRALVPVTSVKERGSRLAWTYIAAGGQTAPGDSGRYLPGGVWPEQSGD